MGRRLFERLALLCLLIMGLNAGLAGQAGEAGGLLDSPNQGSPWRRFELSGSHLQAVDGVDANTLWAAGTDGLLARWDGAQWAAYDNSKLGAHSYTGIDVLAENAAWAVAERGYVARWDGTAWVAEASNTGTADMNEISMMSPADGWIVGGTTSNVPVVARYNGSAWQLASTTGISRPLFGVDALDSNNAWAVGGRFGPEFVGEVVRWNGTGWSQALQLSSILYAVDMLNTTYGWAVGSSSALWKWDGTTWTQAPAPVPGATVSDVQVNSPTDAWAVASTFDSSTQVWHWDGNVWSTMPVEQTAGLLGIKVFPGSEGWAVGVYSTVYRWDGTSWSAFASRRTTGSYHAVDFVSPDDGWAVGADDPDLQWYGLQHWNGVTWEGYHPPVSQLLITDVDMVASDAVWALGVDGYIFRWDGTAWTTEQGPGFTVYAISMVSATDGWAVGSNGGIAHYNGSTWTSVTSPTTSDLWSLDMASANEGWTGGIGFLLHYRNGTWTQVNPGIVNSVDDIDMLNEDEGWAVGGQGLILHYQNGAWTAQSSPVGTALLESVDMISPTEGWAVGANGSVFGPAVLLHYMNGTWSVAPQPSGLPLRDVFAFDADEGWIVSDSPGILMRMEEEEPAVTPTPVPTGTATASPQPATNTTTSTASVTSTPILPTSTLVPPTTTVINTATSTVTATTTATVIPPTPCAIQFPDVPEGSTFYTFIRCLACRGIVNGYHDGTFGPNDIVTRGQLSKIVSNAAGYSEPAGVQLFEDVQPGSTFYDFIQRLASRGYISGYSCGGVGEPCGGESLPYFRPSSNATRGQISKIVSNAAGFNEPAGAQTFEDVSPGSTFYDFIQRLVSRDIINGYSCGGVGEPCGVSNLPYFRPDHNATRGQTSKIVANTFYPECQTP